MRADFQLDYDVITASQEHRLFLLARLIADEDSLAGIRPALNLSLVIDRSGSMAGDKINYTRQAAQFLVQHLGANDTLSILLYNDRIETLLPPQRLSNKDMVTQRLERITVSSTTNLSGGWLQGCQYVAENLQTGALNRVLLMTDGLANRGVTSRDQLVKIAAEKHGEGITTTTMGLGNDFNEDLLVAMAEAGGGAFYFIESPEVTPDIFREELRGLLSTVGQNLSITLKTTEAVKEVRQLNAYAEQVKGNATRFSLGDIVAHETKTLALELTIPALANLGEQQIGTLRFEYDEIQPDGSRHQVDEMPIRINVRPSDAPLPLPDIHVRKSVLLLQAAQTRQQAIRAADQGNLMEASASLKQMADQITDSLDPRFPNESATLREERDALLEQSEQISEGGQDAYQRKSMVTQAYYTRTNRHGETMELRQRELQRELQQSDMDGETEHILYRDGTAPSYLRWNGQIFHLSKDLIRIGRARHNEIVLDNKGVSRFHCQLRREGNYLILEDVGSTNGTLLNGNMLRQPTSVQVGDALTVSDEQLLFIDIDASSIEGNLHA